VSLERVYEPIRKDMERVETGLRSIYKNAPPRLSGILEHSLGAGGKKVRPALVFLSGSFYRHNPDRLLSMALAVEVLHTATLVHDDAIDNSAVRRGRETINKAWGLDKAILIGDYLLAEAEELTMATENLPVIGLFAHTIKAIASAEICQSQDAFRPDLTREQYIERIAGKTASLLSLATESGARLSEAPLEAVRGLREYGYNLGIAFQIVDDVLDFIGVEEDIGKPVGSDLAEGTITLPSMLLMEHYPVDNPVRRLCENAGDRNDNIRQAIGMFRDSPFVDECYGVAMKYRDRSLHSLEVLPEGDLRTSLKELAAYVLSRKR